MTALLAATLLGLPATASAVDKGESNQPASESKASGWTKRTPTPARIRRGENAATEQVKASEAPTPAKPPQADGELEPAASPDASKPPSPTYKLDDDPSEVDQPPLAAKKTYQIGDETPDDEPPAGTSERDGVHHIDDLDETESDQPDAAGMSVLRMNDDSAFKPGPVTEGESISDLVKFSPAKIPAKPAARQIRPALIRHIQPNVVSRGISAYEEGDPTSPTKIAQQPYAIPTPGDEPEELPEELQSEFKPIGALGTRIRAEKGKFPTDVAEVRFQRDGELYQSLGYRRPWFESQYVWTAPGLAYYPLYFEDVNLERHGHGFGLAQPAVSALNFYGRLPFLPYMMATNRPLELQYTLGHVRPGSYAPFQLHYPPVRARGILAEGAAVAAIFLVIP